MAADKVDEDAWKKLPVEQKVTHSSWKARLEGYQELTSIFQKEDEKSPVFGKYLGLVKKFVTDSNAIAQEKGVEACQAFVQNYASAHKTAGEVCNAVVTKCLNARQKTKDGGIELLMLYIEVDKQEIVIEELLKGAGNKQPKLAATCVFTLKEAFRLFGPKIVQPKPILKNLQKLLDDRDVGVREEAKSLAITLCYWIGDAPLKVIMGNLKPVQVTELETEFIEIRKTKPQKLRFLKSEQQKILSNDGQAAGGNEVSATIPDNDNGGLDEEIDPLEAINPVDITSNFPKNWTETITAKKWSERKEVIDAITKLAESNIKLEYNDVYKDLLPALRKVIAKDNNVICVASAVKCVSAIANGLNKKFSIFANMMIETLLEKLKEKKPAVVAELRTAIDACFKSATLEGISEDLIAAMSNKNPEIKFQSVSFLARCFTKSTKTTLPKKMLKLFLESLCKTMNDTSPEVREASFEAVGTAMKVVGEKPVEVFLSEIDSIKKEKIMTYCNNAVLISKSGKPIKSAAPLGNSGSSLPSASAGVDTRPSTAPASSSAMKSKQRGVSKPTSVKTISAKKKASATNSAKPSSKKKAVQENKQETVGFQELAISDETAETVFDQFVPGDLLKELASSKFSDRDEAVKKIKQRVIMCSSDEVPCQAIMNIIVRKPGMKDNHFAVLKSKLDLIEYLAINCNFSKLSCEMVLADVIDKIGDVKNGEQAKMTLFGIAESVTFELIANQVITIASDSKNPKLKSESLKLLNVGIDLFGIKTIPLKPTIEYIKSSLSHMNQGVRNEGFELISTLYIYLGEPIKDFFASEKSTVLTQMENIITKNKDRQKVAPTRFVKGRSKAGSSSKNDGTTGSTESLENNAAAYEEDIEIDIPRSEIASKITDSLLQQMADSKWKERSEALDTVQNIIKENKPISTNIGDLADHLVLRLKDSNKILVAKALETTIQLAESMGKGIKQYIKILASGIIINFGDRKPALNQLAVKTLNHMITPATFPLVFENEVMLDAVKQENPVLRNTLFIWLTDKLENCKKPNAADLKAITETILGCLEDRNADVRQSANTLLTPMMKIIGFDSMMKNTKNLNKTSQVTVSNLLLKTKENLPVTTTMRPTTAPPSTTTTMSNRVDDEDTQETKPVKNTKTKVASNKASKTSQNSAPSSKSTNSVKETKKAAPALVESAPMTTNAEKAKRAKDEKAHKTKRWDFSGTKGDYIKQLKVQMECCFSKEFIDLLYHPNDFKVHVQAVDVLFTVLNNEPLEVTKSNLDLILRYFTLKFQENNTTLLMKIFEYCEKLFNDLLSDGYILSEYEAYGFLPFLIGKIGDPKDNIKRYVKNLLMVVAKLYSPTNVCKYLLDCLTSKNMKQRAESIDQIDQLLQEFGLIISYPNEKTMIKAIAEQVASSDKGVRNAALNGIVTAVQYAGEEKILNYLKDCTNSVMGMIEERLKRSTKTRPQSNHDDVQSRIRSQSPVKTSINTASSLPPTAVSNLKDNIKERRSNKSPSPSVITDIPLKTNHATELEKKYLAMDFNTKDDYVVKDAPEIPQCSEVVRNVRKRKDINASYSLTQVRTEISNCIDKLDINDIDQSVDCLKRIAACVEVMSKQDMSIVYRKLAPLLLTATIFDFDKAAKNFLAVRQMSYYDYCVYLLSIYDEMFKYDDVLKSVEKRCIARAVISCIEVIAHLYMTKNSNKLRQEVKNLYTCTNNFLNSLTRRIDIVLLLGIISKWMKELFEPVRDEESDVIKVILKVLTNLVFHIREGVIKINDHEKFLLQIKKFIEVIDALPDSKSVKLRAIIKSLLHSAQKRNPQLEKTATELLPEGHQIISIFKAPKNTDTPSGIKKQLAKIFKLFSSKDTMEEGARELFDWTEKHPGTDIWMHTEQPDEQFKSYIERKLNKFKTERKMNLNSGVSMQVMSPKYQKEKVRLLMGRAKEISDCKIDDLEIDDENIVNSKNSNPSELKTRFKNLLKKVDKDIHMDDETIENVIPEKTPPLTLRTENIESPVKITSEPTAPSYDNDYTADDDNQQELINKLKKTLAKFRTGSN